MLLFFVVCFQTVWGDFNKSVREPRKLRQTLFMVMRCLRVAHRTFRDQLRGPHQAGGPYGSVDTVQEESACGAYRLYRFRALREIGWERVSFLSFVEMCSHFAADSSFSLRGMDELL